MSTKTQLALAALLALASLAFSAASANAAKYQQASFKAEVKGVQTYVDEFHHKSEDRCDMSVDTVSNEKVRFRSIKPVLLTATDIPQAKELILTSGDKQLLFPTKAKITRSYSNSHSDLPDDCGDNGGGVVPTPPDCGTRTITPWRLSVDYYKRGHIELQPEDNAGSSPFQNCGSGQFPYLLSGESFGKRSSAELPEDEIFDEKIGKIITIGAGNHFTPGMEGYSETKIDWELSITRIKDKK
jgi:hypothetical protein